MLQTRPAPFPIPGDGEKKGVQEKLSWLHVSTVHCRARVLESMILTAIQCTHCLTLEKLLASESLPQFLQNGEELFKQTSTQLSTQALSLTPPYPMVC